jgi:purine-nucleoside phosphorylase
VDAALAKRAAADGEFIAGLILAGQLDTVGSPRKLPHDLWPDADPAVVAEVWSRALAVGVRAGRFMSAPRFYRDKLHTLQDRLAEAGFAAMGRAVGPAVSAAYRVPERHPVDYEVEREH